MFFELSLAVVMLISAALCAVHAFATRSRGEALFLLLTAIGFGYAFPYVDVNVFGHYTFHGQLTVVTLPFHLGFTWWSFYYMAFCLAERLLGKDADAVHLALLTGFIFGLLEVQWDLTLVQVGVIEFFVPSFADWPFGFHPGIPLFHWYLAVNWVLAYHFLKDARQLALAILLAWLSLVLLPLSVMAGVPLTEPVMDAVRPHLSQYWNMCTDFLHFSSTFFPVGIITALWLRWLGRRLGAL